MAVMDVLVASLPGGLCPFPTSLPSSLSLSISLLEGALLILDSLLSLYVALVRSVQTGCSVPRPVWLCLPTDPGAAPCSQVHDRDQPHPGRGGRGRDHLGHHPGYGPLPDSYILGLESYILVPSPETYIVRPSSDSGILGHHV